MKKGCALGLRITSDELIVLDLERPGKGSPVGGVCTLDRIECEQIGRFPKVESPQRPVGSNTAISSGPGSTAA
jgi:hypothetical protein